MKGGADMPLLATKIKNAFDRKNCNFDVKLKNIIINHVKRGCSGFVINKNNNACVYITTDCITCSHSIVYRYAENEHDFKGYTNRWCDDLDTLVNNVNDMLTNPARRL